jgi:hypothetical protein
MHGIFNRMYAGVLVPDTTLVRQALDQARNSCEPYLFNHVVRSWLFAVRIGQIRNISDDPEVVAVGTLLHDITLNERFNGPRRFEVEGADLARTFARQGRSRQAPGSVDLGQRRAQFDAVDRALQGGGGCPLHGRQLPGRGLSSVRHYPTQRDRGDRQGVSPARHEAAHDTMLLPYRRECARDDHDNFIRDFGNRFVFGYGDKVPSSDDLVANAPFDE